MSKKILFWLLVGIIVMVVDLQGYSANHNPVSSRSVTTNQYQFSAATNDNTSQVNLFSKTEYEGRVFQEDRKIQLKTNSGIRFVNIANYNRLIFSAEVPFFERKNPVELSFQLSFIQRLQI